MGTLALQQGSGVVRVEKGILGISFTRFLKKGGGKKS